MRFENECEKCNFKALAIWCVGAARAIADIYGVAPHEKIQKEVGEQIEKIKSWKIHPILEARRIGGEELTELEIVEGHEEKTWKEKLHTLITLILENEKEVFGINCNYEKACKNVLRDISKTVKNGRLKKYLEEVNKEEFIIKAKEFIRILFSDIEIKKLLTRLYEDPKVVSNDARIRRIAFILTSAILFFFYYHFNKERNLKKTIEFILTPQGFGKTTIVIILIKLLHYSGFLDGKIVNIIVPLKKLREQWCRRLSDVFGLSNVTENKLPNEINPTTKYKINVITLQKLRLIDVDSLNIEKHIFIFDQAERVTKHSALGFNLSRYIRKNKKIFLSELIFFAFPSSEEKERVKKIEKSIKNIDSTINPLCLSTNFNLFNYKIEKIEIKNDLRSILYNKISKRRKKTKCRGINTAKEFGLPIKKYDRLTSEDINHIKKLLEQKGFDEEKIKDVINKVTIPFMMYKLDGWQIQRFVVNSVDEFNLLNSREITINNIPLYQLSESDKLFKKVVEVILDQKYNEKILIYTSCVSDIEYLKDFIEKNVGEKVSINSDKCRISIISDKNASGVDWSSYSVFILLRYPRISFPKLADIIGRPRGAKLFFIYWEFEKKFVHKIIRKIENYLGG